MLLDFNSATSSYQSKYYEDDDHSVSISSTYQPNGIFYWSRYIYIYKQSEVLHAN